MHSRFLTRRAVLGSLAYGIGAQSLARRGFAAASPADAPPWTKDWDAALLVAELHGMEKSYDPAVQMISAYHGDEYSYQSHVRGATVHPTRNSLEYASLLLYASDRQPIDRAVQIIKRMLSLQVKDPGSRYFGLWGWYMEEPPDKMPSADFNWADFNGATLLNILLEHEGKLPPEVAAGCRDALRACAISIRKRNVGLDYTNIAFQGTYVTLATAELLKDDGLLTYAKDRIKRLEATIEVSGSFAEYNSPGYMAVTIGNLSRMLYYVRDKEARAGAARLNALAWRHIAEHWHMPTMQLAGPMSRAYNNNIGAAMWIQKGTNNRVRFLTLEEIVKQSPGGEVSIPTVPWNCPEEVVSIFTSTERRQHRELFVAGRTTTGDAISSLAVEKPNGATLPVEGTTLLTPAFSLGTINRCDCWVQRRNLLAYWGGPSRPPHCVQLRVMKDDYEFTSAEFYAAQEQGEVLGSIRFRLDGGDKHPSLDPVKGQTITLRRMRVELLFEHWENSNVILVDGRRQTSHAFDAPVGSRIAIGAGPVKIVFQAREARFREKAQTASFALDGANARLAVELMHSDKPETIHLPDLADPGCDFTFHMNDSGATLEQVDEAFQSRLYTSNQSANVRQINWKTDRGELSVTTATAVQPLPLLDRAFDASVDAKPYPFRRLGSQPN